MRKRRKRIDAKYVWKIDDADPDRVREMADLSGLPEFIARTLVQRGLNSKDEVDAFLRPRLSSLPDPAELPGLETGAARVWEAIDQQQSIVVYGDYDVDGITSTALMVRVLRALGARVNHFLPHRVDDGYGLGLEPLQHCITTFEADLIITVDCGTSSREAVEHAKEVGVDVIITDHHTPAESLAEPLCLLNPRCTELDHWYPLAGVGVAFMFCFGILKKGRELGRAVASTVDLKQFLDVVAVGTVADIVPLTGVNRALVRAGLKQLETSNNIGLKALKEVAGIKSPVQAKDVGFGIGPRLNAAGRIGTAESGLELMLSDDPKHAGELAAFLQEQNQERRRVEKETLEEAEAMLSSVFNEGESHVVVVANEGWHPGVIGIVASRLLRLTHRPSIVIAIDEDGVGKASCRSIEALHIVDALQECSELLDAFGGHHMAAGFSIQADRIDTFREKLEGVVAKRLAGIDLSPSLSIAGEVDLGSIDQAAMDGLDQLRPFGAENPEPIWLFRNVQLLSPRIVGDNHLKCFLGSGGRQLGAIGFGLGEYEKIEGLVDVVGVPMFNHFRGRTTIEIRIIDLRAAQS